VNCPVDGASLTRKEVEPGLPTYHCGKCDGDWLRFGDYLNWRDRQPGEVPEQPAVPDGEPAAFLTSSVRRCPDCDYLLTRRGVGHGVRFTLDRCGNCNGVWLDGSEWETLRKRGLHDNVHQMFGPGWQFRARSGERRDQLDAQFERQLGPDFARTREFADWVAEHPRRSEIMAYIQSKVR
jgi:Zn-finger nucleic acid-binding protein